MNPRHPDTEEILQAHRDGRSVAEIAARRGMAPNRISCILTNARNRGDIPKFTPVGEGKPQYGRPLMGSLQRMLGGLTKDEYEWLLCEIPEGSTIADFCGALISDAVAEST